MTTASEQPEVPSEISKLHGDLLGVSKQLLEADAEYKLVRERQNQIIHRLRRNAIIFAATALIMAGGAVFFGFKFSDAVHEIRITQLEGQKRGKTIVRITSDTNESARLLRCFAKVYFTERDTTATSEVLRAQFTECQREDNTPGENE